MGQVRRLIHENFGRYTSGAPEGEFIEIGVRGSAAMVIEGRHSAGPERLENAMKLELLLVEHHEINRLRVEQALLGAGARIRITAVNTVADAMAHLGRVEVDCILVEAELQAAEGWQLQDRARNTPLIVLTEQDDRARARQALMDGAQDFISRDELRSDTLLRAIGYAIERKKAAVLRMQLLHTDRLAAIGQLAAGVAHEINNPATYINSNHVFIQEDLTALSTCLNDVNGWIGANLSDEQQASFKAMLEQHRPAYLINEIVKRVDENALGLTRVTNIVRKLQSFSRLSETRTETTDINAVVEAACSMVGNQIRHRAQLVKVLGQLPQIQVDRGELHQVLTNLLVNAAQAIPEGQAQSNRITVRTSLTGNGIKIAVHDTGSGIPPLLQRKIFDPFFTTKGPNNGTGLGLAICAEVVRKHGGTIDFESESGRGTVFEVTLPLDANTSDLPLTTPSSLDVAPMPPLRILAVDDEAMILSAYRRLLREHDLTLVESGQAALAALARDPNYDGILCDLMMPDLDGRTFYQRVETMAPQLSARVVFCTGGAFTPRTAEFIHSLRPESVLEKPISPQALRNLLNRWSSNRLTLA